MDTLESRRTTGQGELHRYARTSDTTIATLKTQAHKLLHDLAKGAQPETIFAPSAKVHACHPINELDGALAAASLWDALRSAMPDLERRDQIFLAGPNLPDPRVSSPRPENLVTTMGHYQGTFSPPLFGFQPTGSLISVRSCEVHVLEDQRIVESWVLLDVLDFLRQINLWPLAPSLGAEGAWQPPATGGGHRLHVTDNDAGATTMGKRPLNPP